MQDLNDLRNQSQEPSTNNAYIIEKMMKDMNFVGMFDGGYMEVE